MTTDTTPLGTVKFTNDDMGDVFVPSMFANDLRRLSAALDWARTHESRGDRELALAELRQAATAARSLADMADSLSTR